MFVRFIVIVVGVMACGNMGVPWMDHKFIARCSARCKGIKAIRCAWLVLLVVDKSFAI